MEIATCLNESLNRQDMYLSRIQDEIGVAISALGKPLGNCFPNPSEQSNEFLKPSIDAAKILTNVHHSISTHRRHVILPHLNSSVRKIIEDYPIDEFLFGDKFAEKLKSSKEIQKTSSDLRLQNPSTSSKTTSAPNTSPNTRTNGTTKRRVGTPKGSHTTKPGRKEKGPNINGNLTPYGGQLPWLPAIYQGSLCKERVSRRGHCIHSSISS
ncbi:uncharacterized protein LOC115879981 [Sitophilus oryzae]|uniref:Uncharacterized protein LOC115879981 n=1 Tax=Sitophilus oryzae TaxID=7048 RepID=A0A6J2XN12_SITOR|nr:uncharacterized protein LOC115879981 [Sitophilus oryzae]